MLIIDGSYRAKYFPVMKFIGDFTGYEFEFSDFEVQDIIFLRKLEKDIEYTSIRRLPEWDVKFLEKMESSVFSVMEKQGLEEALATISTINDGKGTKTELVIFYDLKNNKKLKAVFWTTPLFFRFKAGSDILCLRKKLNTEGASWQLCHIPLDKNDFAGVFAMFSRETINLIPPETPEKINDAGVKSALKLFCEMRLPVEIKFDVTTYTKYKEICIPKGTFSIEEVVSPEFLKSLDDLIKKMNEGANKETLVLPEGDKKVDTSSSYPLSYFVSLEHKEEFIKEINKLHSTPTLDIDIEDYKEIFVTCEVTLAGWILFKIPSDSDIFVGSYEKVREETDELLDKLKEDIGYEKISITKMMDRNNPLLSYD